MRVHDLAAEVKWAASILPHKVDPDSDIVLYGIAWYCMVLFSIAWYCMVLHSIGWYCIELHGIAWCCMVLRDS